MQPESPAKRNGPRTLFRVWVVVAVVVIAVPLLYIGLRTQGQRHFSTSPREDWMSWLTRYDREQPVQTAGTAECRAGLPVAKADAAVDTDSPVSSVQAALHQLAVARFDLLDACLAGRPESTLRPDRSRLAVAERRAKAAVTATKEYYATH